MKNTFEKVKNIVLQKYAKMQRKLTKIGNLDQTVIDDSCLSTTSSTSSPGGNLVDGLPPASSIDWCHTKMESIRKSPDVRLPKIFSFENV